MVQESPDSSPEQVWDPWVRVFHWSLVLSIAAAAWTGFLAGPSFIVLHVAGGLAAAALVLMRIVWGFTGPTHARFSDFIPRLAEVMEHIRGQGHRHLGHNPLGALMVYAKFAVILAIAVTGIAVLGGQLRVGPLAPDLGVAAGFFWRQIHNVLGGLLLVMIGLHLGGVLWESRRSKENLARAMVTGLKEPRPGDAPSRSFAARGMFAGGAIVVIALGLAGTDVALSARAVPGLPVTRMDPTVASECGACHMVYNPSLLPAASWKKLMANLSNHFGEDASLDPKTAAKIEAWLAAHAAGTVDTFPARIFSRTSADAPYSMTATRFWKYMHDRIPASVFKSKAVGSRANCAACHQDAASGLFSPFAIELPEE